MALHFMSNHCNVTQNIYCFTLNSLTWGCTTILPNRKPATPSIIFVIIKQSSKCMTCWPLPASIVYCFFPLLLDIWSVISLRKSVCLHSVSMLNMKGNGFQNYPIRVAFSFLVYLPLFEDSSFPRWQYVVNQQPPTYELAASNFKVQSRFLK